jgi:hypothetical protein
MLINSQLGTLSEEPTLLSCGSNVGRLSLLRFFVVFLCPSRNILGDNLNLQLDIFHKHPFHYEYQYKCRPARTANITAICEPIV